MSNRRKAFVILSVILIVGALVSIAWSLWVYPSYTIAINNIGADVVEQTPELWIDPAIELWNEYKLLIVFLLVGFVSVCIIVPYVIGAVRELSLNAKTKAIDKKLEKAVDEDKAVVIETDVISEEVVDDVIDVHIESAEETVTETNSAE